MTLTSKKPTMTLKMKLDLLIDLAEMYGQDSSQVEKWAWFAKRSRNHEALSLLIGEMKDLKARIELARKTWDPRADTI